MERTDPRSLRPRQQPSKTVEPQLIPAAAADQLARAGSAIDEIFAALGPLSDDARAKALAGSSVELAALLSVAAVLGRAHRDFAPKEAAHLLGVTSSTVRRWCATGRLGRRVGARVVIAADDVAALLAGGAR